MDLNTFISDALDSILKFEQEWINKDFPTRLPTFEQWANQFEAWQDEELQDD